MTITIKPLSSVVLSLLTLASLVSSTPFSTRSERAVWFPRLQFGLAKRRIQPQTKGSILDSNDNVSLGTRGGSQQEEEADEERYSRQVYTLGARAHKLVRSSTIYLDGPARSGLLYEVAKNLALSGVGNICILVNSENDNEIEEAYHPSELDDLGKAYQRAARAEIGHEAPEDDETVLMEYLKRLNPSVTVSIARKSQIVSTSDKPGVLLCVDRPYSTLVNLNNKCRQERLAFVAVETAGVFGRIFCDFGPSFEVVDGDGETPLVVPLDRIEPLEDNLVQVHCIEGEKLDVSKGDCIQFQLKSGETLALKCTVTNVHSPRLFTVRLNDDDDNSLDDIILQVNQEATSFTRIKIPQQVDFVPLEEAVRQARDEGSLFTPCDLEKSFDTRRRDIIFACFGAVESFVIAFGRLPAKTDANEFEKLTRKRLSPETSNDPRVESISQVFCNCCAGKLTPIQAILGAISAQEALKATCGLYNPVQQFLLYDCEELLPDSCDDLDCGTTGQSYILGQNICESLANSRLFVVGAGAIGCELLKNLSAMGASTGTGRIIVTDMDTIEKSNLSRQLLFRDTDIGKFKSAAAEVAVKRFNPDVHVDVHTSKVGDKGHGPFNDVFWSKGIDSVLNALDNMEARLYIDGQCVTHQKSLVDAGTLGPKGNVQVVVPHQSESYGSSVDPPEPAIPVCTLKTFPYSISHTIQWGRDLFDGCFQRRPKQANDYAEVFSFLGVEDFAERLINDVGEEQAQEIANELSQDWAISSEIELQDTGAIRETCIKWAVKYAKELFNDAVEDLLRQHPIDSLDEDGELFWSGTRRPPRALAFVDVEDADSQQKSINNNLIDFVRSAARLRIEMFLPETSMSFEDSNVSVEEAVDALLTLKEEKLASSNKNIEHSSIEATAEIRGCLSSVAPKASLSLQQVEFEKDDETNGHVSFVTAASNLRALCYGIAPVDAMETRRVAGRIVPAMISTTAFVSALSCVELLKLLQKVPLERHRNGFINLALPFFAYTAPMAAEQVDGLHGTTYTLWDRITVKESKKSAKRGGVTLRKFLKLVTKKATKDPDKVSVSTISYGPYMLYASFLHESDDEMLDRPIMDLLKEAILSSDKDEFADREGNSQEAPAEQQIASLDGQRFADFTIVVEDLETGDEVELPPVRLEKRHDLS
jgi:ubiquitin-activating enzyme E1